MEHWYQLDRPLILASTSPRRSEILSMLGLAFSTRQPALLNEESFVNPARIEDSLKMLADKKAATVSAAYPEALVLGADTVVWVNGMALGKPRDRAHAQWMIRQLSGAAHVVYTAIGVRCESGTYFRQAIGKTVVHFRSVDNVEIDRYLDFNDYSDKAGAYAIQGRAMAFIDKIDGCYYNVMGLPVSNTLALISDFVCRKE